MQKWTYDHDHTKKYECKIGVTIKVVIDLHAILCKN